MTWQAMTAVFTIFTFLPTSAFAGLDGINWHSEQDYISAHGRLELTSNNKFCTFIDRLECKVREPGKLPIYYLLECDRNRRICEAVSAKLLRGEPWLVKQEYRITEWDAGHVSASMKDPPYQCLVAGLRIDLDGREVVFTETYTRSIENDAFCVPENVGHTTTYKWKKRLFYVGVTRAERYLLYVTDTADPRNVVSRFLRAGTGLDLC
jgi:hypothetical protein